MITNHIIYWYIKNSSIELKFSMAIINAPKYLHPKKSHIAKMTRITTHSYWSHNYPQVLKILCSDMKLAKYVRLLRNLANIKVSQSPSSSLLMLGFPKRILKMSASGTRPNIGLSRRRQHITPLISVAGLASDHRAVTSKVPIGIN